MKDKNNWLYGAIFALLSFGIWMLINSSQFACVILSGRDSASCYNDNVIDIGTLVANLIGPFLPIIAIVCFVVWIVMTISEKGKK